MKAIEHIRHTAVILTLCMVMLVSVSCGGSLKNNDNNSAAKDSDNINPVQYIPLGQQDGMDIVAENDEYKLLLNTNTCTINVLVKKTGYIWRTNLSDGEFSLNTADDIISQYKSQLALTFYDCRGKQNTYYSFPQSVSKQQFDFYSVENGVRIIYRIGDTGEDKIYPDVLSKSTLESDIFPKLSKEQRDRILHYYILTEYQKLSDADKANISSKYPIIKNEPIYIPKKINIRIRKELTGYFKEAGLTLEMLNQEYDKVGYTGKLKLDPCFTVAIDYQLTSQGLRNNIASDLISAVPSGIHLTRIDMLPYFGCGSEGEKGYMLIPDGSGS